MVVRTLGGDGGSSPQTRSRWLELAGEALAAGGDARRASQQALRVAVEATGARAGAIWRLADDGPELISSHGELGPAQGRLERLVDEAVATWQPSTLEPGDPAGDVLTLPLGQPTFAALQLFYARHRARAGRAAGLAGVPNACRARCGAGEHVTGWARARPDALAAGGVGEAMRSSLAHAETAVRRTAELLQITSSASTCSTAGACSPPPAAGSSSVTRRSPTACSS